MIENVRFAFDLQDAGGTPSTGASSARVKHNRLTDAQLGQTSATSQTGNPTADDGHEIDEEEDMI